MTFTTKSALYSLMAFTAVSFLLIYISDRFILTVNFYQSNGDLLSGVPGEENQVYQSLQGWIYVSSAAFQLIKFWMITIILYTALYLYGRPVSFIRIFQVVVLAEFIFFVPAIFKIFWFHFILSQITLIEWHKFYVLSALSILQNIPADWWYALQTLNLFEAGYWFLLAYGISRVSGMDYDLSLRVVVFSYLPALVIWVALVTLCTLVMFSGTG
jgi:hypothetical protein